MLLVGITREDRAETLRSLRDELLIAGPIALLLATLAGYGLAGLALRPVESMRRRAAAISAERPGERLPVPQTRDEVERLGETLNAMLARLEAALVRERTFVADAGHELRTPLALLRTELELALRHGEGEEELRDALRRSSAEVDRLTQLAESLLLIARSDEGHLELRVEELEPAELLDSIVTRFEWRAKDAGRPVSAWAAPGLVLRGDRMRLEQALGNLVENALRHGGGEVRLSAQGRDGIVELHVRDEGGGFPPDFLADAFTRFARPDQGRSRGGLRARPLDRAHDRRGARGQRAGRQSARRRRGRVAFAAPRRAGSGGLAAHGVRVVIWLGAHEGAHRRHDRAEILPALRLAQHVCGRLAVEIGVGSEEPRLRCLVSVGVDDHARRLVALAQADLRLVAGQVLPRDPARDHLGVLDAADVRRHPLPEMLLEVRDDLRDRQQRGLVGYLLWGELVQPRVHLRHSYRSAAIGSSRDARRAG